jgi:glycosyltransferase involved in cell wall biosynthesis
MPKVSVIIPNYNHAQFLRQRVDSVLGQTYQDFEVILLDDCSTDESRFILSEYAGDPRVRIEFNDKNSGSPFKQWNRGVRLARGEYVWIAESDDYAEGRLLERLVAVLDEEPTVAFAYCRSWRVSEDDRLDGFVDPHVPGPDLYRWTSDYRADGHEECRKYLVRNNTVPNTSAVVFRTAIYERVGGADEGLRLCGDWKLWASMALTGRMAYVGEPLNYFRFHDASVRSKTQRSALDVAEMLQVIRWVMDRARPSEIVREEVCADKLGYWVSALMSLHVPLGVKLAVLRNAMAIDRHAMRRAVHPALVNVRLKFLKHWREVRSIVMRTP